MTEQCIHFTIMDYGIDNSERV